MRLALYQPEIPQNTGTLLRLGACVGVDVDIIEPCGFVWNAAKLRRAGMDYLDVATYQRYPSWAAYHQHTLDKQQRLILLDVSGATIYTKFPFQATDTLVVGKESCGVPASVRKALAHSVHIPMVPGQRSLNMAVATAMVMGEALRQTNWRT